MTLSRDAVAFTTPRYADPADASLPTRCIALTPDGDACGRESIGNGAPMDVCGRHALELYLHMTKLVRDAEDVDIPGQMNAARLMWGRDMQRLREQPDGMNGWPSVVYYISAGNHLKIGTTTRLRARMREYPPCTRLLAVEPGAEAVERVRHQQFAQHRVTREWFDPAPDLLAHVRAVWERGLPPAPSTEARHA